MTVNLQAVVETRMRNPCATLQQMGDKYGVSREWIRQMLEPFNFPTGISQRILVSHTCPNCGGSKGYRAKLCLKCYTKIHNIQLACSKCEQLFTRNLSEVIFQENVDPDKRPNKKPRQFWFCSHKCGGKWIGKHYGFGIHPEHRRRRKTINRAYGNASN